ncbi:MAG: HAD-IIIC family phosphatase [Kiritimatiellia bacterium]
MRIALTGDVALDLMAPYFRAAGHEVYVPAGFGAWRQELLDPASPLHAFRPEVVYDVTAHDAVLADEVPNFHDERMRALASMPYSLDGIRAIVDELAWQLAAAPKKVLAVDADNTLWAGVISEDGKASVAPYLDFQRGLLQLRDEGVVLALVSKNDPVFPFMRADMPLADEDFAVCKVTWRPKAGSVIELCRELNLGVESVVFLDDNSYERAQMAAHLPSVAIAPWCGAPSRQTIRRLREYFFADMGRTEEDRLRAAGYRARAASQVADFATVGDYLESLGLHVAPSVAAEGDLDRLAQMAGKTNQFNATTLRRTRDEFAALLRDPARRVFVFRAGDRFAEMGIVCYVVVDLASRHVTDFVMSCRAMGRTLEYFVYRYVGDRLGYRPILDFTPTAKNLPFKAFREKPEGRHYYTVSETPSRHARLD